MGNNEAVGLGVIVFGVVLVVGAVRGTWKAVFNDLLAGSSPPTSGSTHGPGGPGGGIGGGGKPASQCTPIDCITGKCDPLGPGCISGFPTFGYVTGQGAPVQVYSS